MAIDLTLMSFNDYIDSQCSPCLFEECMDCNICTSCVDAMHEEYSNMLSINPITTLYDEICDC